MKVKNARHGLENPNARYRKEVTIDDVLTAPLVSDPLGLLDICATSDGAAAIVVVQPRLRAQPRRRPTRCACAAISTVTPSYPQTTIELPNFATDSAAGAGAHARARVQGVDRGARLRGGGHRPRRPRLRRGVRPLHRDGARLVRADRAVRAGRGREAAPRRRDDDRRPHPGEPERRPRLLRRSRSRAGDRAGVRAHLAAAGPGRRAARSRARASA